TGGGCRREGVAVIPGVVITEDAALSAWREHYRIELRFCLGPFLVEQNKEVRLVPYYGSAQASRRLLKVSPGPARGLSGKRIHRPVVLPNVGIQNRVLGAPHPGAMELVRSRSRLNLNLSAAAAHFRIDGRQNHLDFANEVGLYFCPRVDTGRPSRAVHGDAIPLHIDVPGADAGKLCVIGSKYRTDC